MSTLFKRKSGSNKKKNKAFRAFEQKCSNEKSINLNPLLAIIINLVPMFLIVLNMRAISGFEQTNIPEATYTPGKSVDSKTTYNVDIKLYKDSTQVILRNHKGKVVESKKFKNIIKNKEKIAKHISQFDKTLGHLNILTPKSTVKFDEIAQAIDLGSLKKESSDKKLFTNFSIGNIL